MVLKGQSLHICNLAEIWTRQYYESHFKALQRSGLATRFTNFEC